MLSPCIRATPTEILIVKQNIYIYIHSSPYDMDAPLSPGSLPQRQKVWQKATWKESLGPPGPKLTEISSDGCKQES